jgi:hypothetical protein
LLHLCYVLVASLFGHVGGQEWAEWGDSGVLVLQHWQLPDHVLVVFLGVSGWFEISGCRAKLFRAKAQRSHASGNDTCGRCYPLGGTIMVTFPTTLLQVKTLDHLGLDDGSVMRPILLGASSWSFGISWFCSVVISGQIRILSWGSLDPCVGCSRRPPILYTLRGFTILRPRWLPAGSTLHVLKGEGRRPSPLTTWWVRCGNVRWFYKKA